MKLAEIGTFPESLKPLIQYAQFSELALWSLTPDLIHMCTSLLEGENIPTLSILAFEQVEGRAKFNDL